MSKINVLALFVVVAVCAAFGVPAAMAETIEFEKVGSQLKETGGEAVFTSAETPVTCASSKGSGGVASSTQLKLKIVYEGCIALLSKESIKAKVSTCDFNYEAEGSAKVLSGCVVSISECSLTPSSGKQLKIVLYNSVENKEGKEAEHEMEASMGLEGVPIKASGSSCEKLGIKGSEEGTIIDAAEMQIGGARALPPRNIHIAVPAGETLETELKNTSNQTFKFPGLNNKTMTCTSMVWKGTTMDVLANPRTFKTLTSTCTSNILLSGMGAEATATLTFMKCEFGIRTSNWENLPEVAGLPGVRNSIETNEACVFKASISVEARTCEITFAAGAPGTDWNSVGLRNLNIVPKAVEVRYPFLGAHTRVRYSASTCASVDAAPNSAILEGTSIFKAWKIVGGREEKAVEIV
jgi:hypothetical protein